MLSFHTAPVRGRAAAEPSAALVPTLGAIEKCKFILVLPILPTCKTILGHNGPTERQPGERGSRWAGKHPVWERVERAALRVRAAHGAPGAGEALGGDFPLGRAPSIPGEPAEGSAPGGKPLKVTPKPTLCLVSAKEGEGLRGEGQEGIGREQSHSSPVAPDPLSQVCRARGAERGGLPCAQRAGTPHPAAFCGAVALGCRSGPGSRSCPQSEP